MEQVHQRIEDEAIDQHRKASLRHRQNRDAEEPTEYLKRLRSDENADGPPSPMRQQGSKTPRPTTFETLAAESLQGMKRTMSSTSLALSFMSPESLDEFEQKVKSSGQWHFRIEDIRGMRKRFYAIVLAEYWELIESGHLVPCRDQET